MDSTKPQSPAQEESDPAGRTGSAAEWISQLRASEGLTQEEFAERLGTIRDTVAKWETGATKPSYDYVRKIQQVLQVAPRFDRLGASRTQESGSAGTPQPRSIGEWVRRVRRVADLSQEAFAEQLGAGRVTVANWERGKKVPRGDMVRRIQELFPEAPPAHVAPSRGETDVSEFLARNAERLTIAQGERLSRLGRFVERHGFPRLSDSDWLELAEIVSSAVAPD